jgi:predicted Zn-dependent peptidase
VPAVELARVKNKMRADYYSGIELPINRADTIALAQLLLGDANAVNTIPADIESVTSGRPAARGAKYLTAGNRTVVDRKPAAPEAKKE